MDKGERCLASAPPFNQKTIAVNITTDKVNKYLIVYKILTVVSIFSFKVNALRVSELLRDRRRTPLQKTGDWIEYAVRHKDMRHFRPAVFDIPWYQYYLLDVLTLFVTVVTFIVLLAKRFGKYACILLRRRARDEKEKSKRD